MKALRLLFLVLALPTLPGSAQTPPAPSPSPTLAPLPSVSLPQELDRLLRDYEKRWKAGNGAALADLFTEDGFVLSNGAPPVRGRGSIRAAHAHPGGDLRLRALACGTEGSLGYIIGAFGYANGAGATVAENGKFVLVVRKSPDGVWQIVADMDNGNRRPR